MKKYNLFLMLVIFVVLIFNFNFVNSVETKNIEYEIRITFTPYCDEEICETLNITNSTNINTTCHANCYGKIKIEGINDNNLFFEIDTNSDDWRDGHFESRFGYKTADLGNLSDITGIREDLKNCTDTWNTLFKCYDTVRTLDLNLTNCLFKIEDGNLTIGDCKIQKNDLENRLNTKSSEVSAKTKELEDKKNDKIIYGVIAFVLGIVAIKFGVPWAKGRNTPKDPNERGFASNVPH